MEHRIATYLGGDAMVTALGGDTQSTFDAIEAHRCGLHPVEQPCPLAAAGQIAPELLDALRIEGLTPLESALVHCAKRAAAESHLAPDDERCALVVSSTKGNVALLEGRTTPPDEAFLYTMARRIARQLGIRRPPVVVSNACISGVTALIVARRMILDGECDHVIIAGGDLLSEFVATGFLSFKSVSPGPCRPYDASPERGLSLGEAVAAVVVTADPARAKLPAVRLEGGAITDDANHISGPSRTGDGLHYAIEGALREAALPRERLSFVNTHGTGTAYNDAMESLALELSHLSDCPANSLKGSLGHTLGASGVVESILAAEELRRGVLLGTAGFERPGTPVPINVSAENRPLAMRHCLKTASGFGGCNAAIVLGLGEFASDTREGVSDAAPERRCRVTARWELPHTGEPFAQVVRACYHALEAPNMKFFKMDDLAKAAYVAAEHLLGGRRLTERYAPTDIAVVLENTASSLDTDLAHQRIVEQHLPEGTSPAVFVYTLPNVAAGEICIRHHLQGEDSFFITDPDHPVAERYARRLIARGAARAVVCGRCEYLAGEYDVRLMLLEADDGNE